MGERAVGLAVRSCRQSPPAPAGCRRPPLPSVPATPAPVSGDHARPNGRVCEAAGADGRPARRADVAGALCAPFDKLRDLRQAQRPSGAGAPTSARCLIHAAYQTASAQGARCLMHSTHQTASAGGIPIKPAATEGRNPDTPGRRGPAGRRRRSTAEGVVDKVGGRGSPAGPFDRPRHECARKRRILPFDARIRHQRAQLADRLDGPTRKRGSRPLRQAQGPPARGRGVIGGSRPLRQAPGPSTSETEPPLKRGRTRTLRRLSLEPDPCTPHRRTRPGHHAPEGPRPGPRHQTKNSRRSLIARPFSAPPVPAGRPPQCARRGRATRRRCGQSGWRRPDPCRRDRR